MTVLHGLVQVEREGSKPCEWWTGETVYDELRFDAEERHCRGDATGARQRDPLPRWCGYYRTHLANSAKRIVLLLS
jgi:hypothetical protein